MRAAAGKVTNARLAMMDFPKAAVIGIVGTCAVPHDYMLDALDLPAVWTAQAEMESRRRRGETVIVRSHDLSLLRTAADEIWWFTDGDVRAKGHPDEVLTAYFRDALSRAGTLPAIPVALRRGDGRARLLSIETLNSEQKPAGIWQSGETVSIRVTVKFEKPVDDPVIGIMLRTRVGMEVYGTNTQLEKLTLGPCAEGDLRTVRFEFECNLCPQFYTITAASHDPDGVWHDWMEDAIGITVADSRYTAGVANLRARVTCYRG